MSSGHIVGNHMSGLIFIFQTTSKGKSYFDAYNDYQKWEEFIQKVKKNMTRFNPASPLVDMFQTSDFWPEVIQCASVDISGSEIIKPLTY